MLKKDIESFNEKFGNTNRSTVNICPGFEISYTWSKNHVVAKDKSGEFTMK